jgi:hypothetical protein
MHNWLRSSGPAAIVAELVAGSVELSHEALDAHPRRRSADHLRHLLVTADLLAPRDDAIVALEAWVSLRLEETGHLRERRLLRSYATWRVLRPARQRAAQAGRMRSPTRHAKSCLNAAISLCEFSERRGLALAEVTQHDVDEFMVEGASSAAMVADFLDWTASRSATTRFEVRPRPRQHGPRTDDEARFATARRLLSDEDSDLVDRVAGCLVLLYGQQLTRISTLRREQVVTGADGTTRLHLGATHIEVPSPLDVLLQRLSAEHRHHSAFSVAGMESPWLFPGSHHGRPMAAATIGQRLRRLGIEPQAARRGALLHLGASLPAAVMARLLGLHATTAVRWVADAGGDWNDYAAEVLRSAMAKPAE